MSRFIAWYTNRADAAPIARALSRAAMLACAATLAAGCSADSNPVQPETNHLHTPSVPDFIYASNAAGPTQIYRYSAGRTTRVTFDSSTDENPSSAAGRIVFTSYRDGDPEIYVAGLDGSGAKRLTTSSGLDDNAALDPTGAHIVFVSSRGGVPRLYVMDSTGANQTALSTGSASWVPEGAPKYSPDGSQIAFTSTRTGISQVYVMPATGGNAVQVTHESGGAFDPAWSSDASQLYFVSASGTPSLRVVTLSTGATADYARSTNSLGQPACNGSECLAVSGAYGSSGSIVFYSGANSTPTTLVQTPGNSSSPAFLVP